MQQSAQLLVALFAVAAPRAFAQGTPPPSSPTNAASASETSRVHEVGGRLVISGETVEVTADAGEPIRVSSLATKTETSLLETPRSVSIVDRRMLDELAAIDVAQAHDYTVGFSPLDQRGPAEARGFPVGFYDVRRDGLRTFTWSVREPVGLDRIQYLRGPAGLLYGDGSPGGLVNLMLKKPLPVARYETSLGAGELGYLRFTTDLTGPLSNGRTLRYRLVGAAEALANGFDNDESRVSVLPMLAFDLGPGVTFHLDGEYYDQRGRGYRHVVPATPESQRGDFSRIPWNLNVSAPDDGWRGWNASCGLRLDARLSESASLHVAGRYTRIDGDLDVHGLIGLAAGGNAANRFLYGEESRWDEYQSDSFAAFSLSSGRVVHRIVTGVEAGLSTVDSRIGSILAAPLELAAPVYAPRSSQAVLVPTGSDLGRFGAYVQDQIQLGSRFTVVPALRLSLLRLESRAPAGAGDTRTTDEVVSPGFGAVFLPRPWLSFYVSWAEGFEPPAPGQFQEDGRALDPVESRSLEAGVKADLLERRLSLSASGFGTRQTNVTEADPRGFYQQIAEGESRGLEVEVTSRPARGLDVRGGYAFTETEITRDLSGFAGRELPNAPRHKANVWVHYRFSGGPSRRLALGAGVVRLSDRFSNRANTVTVPGYTRVDATASYALLSRRLTLVLSAQNMTDTRYVTSGSGQVFFVGPPRRLAVTATTSF